MFVRLDGSISLYEAEMEWEKRDFAVFEFRTALQGHRPEAKRSSFTPIISTTMTRRVTCFDYA